MSSKSEWKQVAINEISKSIQYGLTSRSGKNLKGPKYLRITDIQDGSVDWSNVPQSEVNEDIDKYRLNDGDIVFARTGATVGKSFLIKNLTENAVFASYLIRIIVDDKQISPELLSYYFQSPMYWGSIMRSKRGIGQPNVNGKILGELRLIIPTDKKIQEKIVDEIETQFTRLDVVIKSIKTMKAKLGLYRRSILNDVFDGCLSKGKLTFEEKLIKDIAKIKGGKRLPQGQRVQDESTRFPYIRVTDFDNYSVNFQELKFITEDAYKQISRYVIYDNEVFISIAGTIGRVGIIPSELNGANLTENAAKLTDIEGVLPKYLMYYLSSPKAAELISFSTKSTSQPKLALFRIGNLKVKYPSNKKDQQQIVGEIELHFSIIDNLEKIIDAALVKAEKLRKSILKFAFEGKLVEEL